MTVLLAGGGGLVDDEPVGRGHVLVVGQVEQVVDGALVDAGQQGQQVGRGPAPGRLGAWAWPVLVLAQVRSSHRDASPVRVQPGSGSVVADALAGLLQAPPVGVPPRTPGPPPVAAGGAHPATPPPRPPRPAPPPRPPPPPP